MASNEAVGEESELSSEDKDFYLNIKPQTGYDLSLFMVGITGAGKSSFCNFLCNEEVFEMGGGFMSVSQVASLCRFKFGSKEVLMIDSPGFCDSYRSDQEIFDEICKIGVIAKDGTDAVALVINSGERFSDNHRKAFLMMEQLGGSFWEHTFIVFTKECEVLKSNKVKSGEEFLNKVTKHPKCPPLLTEMLSKTENRYVFVDSIAYFQNEGYRNDICAQLFKLIEKIHQKNDHKRYNNNLMNQGKKFFNEMEEAHLKEKRLRDELDTKNKKLEEQMKTMKVEDEQRRKDAEDARKQEEWRKQETERLKKEQQDVRMNKMLENQEERIKMLEKQIVDQRIKDLEEKNKTLEREKEEEKRKRERLEEKQEMERAEEISRMKLEANKIEMEAKAKEYKQNVATEAKNQSWVGWAFSKLKFW